MSTLILQLCEHDDEDTQIARIERFSKKLCDAKNAHVNVVDDYVDNIMKCFKHCSAALSVLETKIISKISGKALLGHDGTTGDDIWLEVCVRRASPTEEVKSETKVTHGNENAKPVVNVHDEPHVETFSEWFVLLNDYGHVHSTLENALKRIDPDVAIQDLKILENMTFAIVRLPVSRQADIVSKMMNEKIVISVESNRNGHQKSL